MNDFSEHTFNKIKDLLLNEKSYLTNDFNEQMLLLNDRSVRKRKK